MDFLSFTTTSLLLKMPPEKKYSSFKRTLDLRSVPETTCNDLHWTWEQYHLVSGCVLPCAGYGPRLPLIVVSPWAKQNFVDNTLTDQSSIIRFIEDNWLGGQRIGNRSFDAIANSITQMFKFTAPRNNGVLFLNPTTGEKE